MSVLSVATRRELPVAMLVDAIAILARRGAGKTYTGNVLVEEAIEHGVPVVVLDPTGVWWGLRSNAKGNGPGYPVVILGGEHGDVPLEPTAGKVIADLVVDRPAAYILDVSGFESNAAQDRFATDFAERLYRRKATERDPVLFVVDEADSFAPQRPQPGQQRMLGAFEAIVRRGRSRGLGVVLISQRAAVLNKNVLTQCEVLFALQTTGPQDRAAILDWVKGAGTPTEVAELTATLASLDRGEAWLWSPQLLQTFERIRIRKRTTFDASATPQPGAATVSPKAFAPVDIEQLGAAIAATVDKAKADDPKLLRARIADLERAVAAQPTPVEVRVEVPVLSDDVRTQFEVAFSDMRKHGQELVDVAQDMLEAIASWRGVVRRGDESPNEGAFQGTSPDRGSAPVATRPGSERPPAAPRETRPAAAGGTELGDGAARKILTVLAVHGPRTQRQAALQAGYTSKTSTVRNALATLRRLGYIEPGQPITPTDDGLLALGDFEPLPAGEQLLEYWRGELGDGAVRAVFDAMVSAYPNELRNDELAGATGYTPTTSTLRNALARLRSLGLVDGWRLSDDLAAATGVAR